MREVIEGMDGQTDGSNGPGLYFLFSLVIFFSVGYPSLFNSPPVEEPPDNDEILYEPRSSTGVMWMDTASREETKDTCNIANSNISKEN